MSTAVLTKIENLLRLSRSNNPHEADSALQAAHRLARKNKIDIQSVDPDREEEPEFRTYAKKARASTAKKYIFMILQNYFSVRVFWNKAMVTLIGTVEDCKVAVLVMDWLTREYNARWKYWKGMGGQSRRAFYAGMTRGIMDKLQASEDAVQQENPASYALVVVKQDEALKEFVESVMTGVKKANLKKVRTGDGRVRRDYTVGYEEGESLEIPDFSSAEHLEG